MGTPDNTNFPWLGGDPTNTYPKPWQLTINGVKCAIFQADDNGIVERNLGTGREAAVQFICNWNQRNDLMAGLLGTVDYADGKVIRQDPFAYPVSTGDQELIFTKRTICTSITNIKGLHWWTDGTSTSDSPAGSTVADPALPGWGAYVYAVITAEFTTPLYWISADPDTPNFDDLFGQTYCISKIRAGGEALIPPFGGFVYADDNSPVFENVSVQLRTRSEISCTRVRMPIYPVNAIQAAMNSVNAKEVKIAGYKYPAESILLNNVVPEPRSDPLEGGIVWDVELVFIANSPSGTGQINGADSTAPLSWNYYLNAKGDWKQIKSSATGKPPYRLVDWGPGGTNDLFSNTIS